MGSPLRISGMATGMDTESTIKKLMDAEKVRLNKFNQDKQIKKWTQEAYNNTNKDLASFILDTKKDLELTKTTESGLTISGSTNNFSWVKKGVSADTGVVDVTAAADATPGNHSITINNLAENVNLGSTQSVVEAHNDSSLEINGVKIDLKSTEDYATLAQNINKQVQGIKASYDAVSKRFFISTTKSGEKSSLLLSENTAKFFSEKLNIKDVSQVNVVTSASSVEDKKLSDLLPSGTTFPHTIKIEGRDIQLQETDTVTMVSSKINAEMKKLPKLDVEVKYENGKFTIINKKPVNAPNNQPPILLDANAADFFKDQLKIADANVGTKYFLKQGKNAMVDFDGATNIEYESNQFSINGINISAKKIGTTNIKVDTDVDGVYGKIKGFVDKYNELLDKLNTKITEKKHRDYKPLTDEQKKAMEKDDVKLWEDKAKSGLLNQDENINRIISTSRGCLYDSVYDKFDLASVSSGKLSGYSMLTEIGITTGTYQEKGKLKIDETKLKAAIKNDADGVMNLLFKTSDMAEGAAISASQKNERQKESGIVTRIYDSVVGGMKDIINKSGTGDNAIIYRNVKSNLLIDFVTKNGSLSTIDKDVLSIEKQISSENNKLSRKESAYYKKFTALETSMNKMNSQSSWLASQLGGR